MECGRAKVPLHFARASSRPGPRVSRGHLKEPGSVSQKTSLPCLHRDLGGVIHGFYSLFLPIEDPLMCGKSSISPYGRSRLPSYGPVGDSVKAALSGPIYRLGRPTLNGSFLDFRNSRVFEPTRSSRPRPIQPILLGMFQIVLPTCESPVEGWMPRSPWPISM
jgi:hypothetical protein